MSDLVMDNTALAAALRSSMEAQGLSISTLALKAHISKSTLSKILSGSTSPYVHTLYQICEALGIGLADILLAQEDILNAAKNHHLSDEELRMVVFVRGLSDGKRRWLLESLELLAAYGEQSFPE